DHSQTALLAGAADLGRNTVGAINDTLAFRDFVNRVNEDGALALELFDYKAVVHDLFADVDRRPEGFEGNADDINGADDAGAKASGFQQKQGFLAIWQ